MKISNQILSVRYFKISETYYSLPNFNSGSIDGAGNRPIHRYDLTKFYESKVLQLHIIWTEK